MIIVCGYIFKLPIRTIYLSFKHKDTLKEYLTIVANGSESDIDAIFTQNSPVLKRRSAIEYFQKVLKHVEINTLQFSEFSLAKINNEDGDGEIIFADSYFENDIDKVLHVQLEYQNNKWLIRILAMPDYSINGIPYGWDESAKLPD